MKTKQCLHCGKPFAPKSNREFCSVECRFWNKVDTSAGSDSCWPWKAWRYAKGYGTFKVPNCMSGGYAHRFAYILANGPLPRGMHVCHSCDNPPCCNPAHLWAGTAGENIRDMTAKGRGVPPHFVGEVHPSAKLTEAQALSIRSDRRSPRIIAAEYGVSVPLIQKIRSGSIWKHLNRESRSDA